MAITREEFNERILTIGQCEDDLERRNLLTTLSNDIADEYDKIDTLTTNNQKLTEDLQKAQDYNMELFLQVGGKSQKQATQNVLPDEQPKEKLKFEDLFNEKGGLK
jgi:hypothetical protein